MNVASLEPSEELFELSEWVDPEENRRHIPGAPFYSLGYLLRKLQIYYPQIIWTHDKYWDAGVDLGESHPERDYPIFRAKGFYANTPENAVCKLAIELFKQGILPSKEKDSE